MKKCKLGVTFFVLLAASSNLLGAEESSIAIEVEKGDENADDEGSKFYRLHFIKFLDSEKPLEFLARQESRKDMTEIEKTFFDAGFIRGILEYVELADFKQSPGFAKYHFQPRGENNLLEKTGWLAGCRAGKEAGDAILTKFRDHLQQKEPSK